MPERRGKPPGNPGTEGGSMNEDSFARQPVKKGVVGGLALLSALIPVYVCAYSALLVNE